MAFNPFHTFRKHQKKFFVALTIMCMVTFVLMGSSSLGGGDFFGWVQNSFGGRSERDRYASLYGKDYSQQDLVQVYRQRELAYNFLMMALESAGQKLRKRTEGIESQLQAKAPHLTQQLPLLRFMMMRGMSSGKEYLAELDRLAEGARFGKQEAEAELLTRLREVAADEVKLVETMVELGRQFRGVESAAGGVARLRYQPQDLLDFLNWKQQADRLGIHLTREAIRDELNRDTLGLFSTDDSAAIERGLSGPNALGRFSSEALVNAIGDEYRVRLAKRALLGQPPVTPEEFWRYFQEQRTETEVTLLSVPVKQSAFLDKTGTPPEDELQALFNKYRKQEYQPSSAEPGFKQPQRIEAAWVGARPGLPYYQQQAAQAAAVLPGLSWLLAGAGPTPAAPPAATALQVVLPVAVDLLLLDRYEQGRFTSAFDVPSWTKTDDLRPTLALHDSSTKRPAAGPLGFGVLLAATPVHGPAVLGTLAGGHVASTLAREVQDRIAFGSSVVLAGALPTPLTSLALEAYGTPRERYRTYTEMQEYLKDKLHTSLAQRLVSADLKAFKAEVEKLGKNKPDEIKKLVAERVKDRSWEYRAMTTPAGRLTIADAEALQPLKETLAKTSTQAGGFAEQVAPLFKEDLYTLQELPPAGSPDDDFSWSRNPQRYLYWKFFNQPEYVPDSLAKVRDQVVEAWRLRKARGLAKAEADKLEAEVRKAKGDLQRLKDQAQQAKVVGKIEELKPVAPLLPGPANPFNPTAARDYQPYRVSEDKVQYPGPDFATKLLGLKEVGDTTVLTNQPEDTYYVATVTRRTPAAVQDFIRTYEDAVPGGFLRQQDRLLSRFEEERKRQFEEKVLEQLRAGADVYLNPDAAREGRGGSDGE